MQGINVIYYDVAVTKNYKIMLDKVAELKGRILEIPVIIIGNKVLSSEKECIKANIDERIKHIKEGGEK